jgi:glucosamine 6-phosphate synthetase-like amidotransferase/phosphosugar isomerase protein
MCGIAGYIGASKKPKTSFELITALFDFLETRGFDASGVWATEHGGKGRVLYHKEPIRSSKFIKDPFWQRLKKIKTDTVLIHARATSSQGGNANVNANNHPFVSVDKRIGMVHNGNIDEAEYLKSKYQTLSQTDSECLLRIYEHGMDSQENPLENISPEITSRLNGIKDIWSHISQGAMAVALGERISYDERGLFLFRNEKRPLWLVDLRDLLGQIFFFSTPDIWSKALLFNPQLQNLCFNSTKLIELPSRQAWYFSLNHSSGHIQDSDIYRFQLKVYDSGKEFEIGSYKEIKPAKADFEIVSNLDEDDEIKTFKKPKGNTTLDEYENDFDLWKKDDNFEVSDLDKFSSIDYEDSCFDIGRITKDIEVTMGNLISEGSMDVERYDSVLQSLNQIKDDLKGTLRLVQN